MKKFLIAAALFISLTSSVSAATYYWIGTTSSNWNNPANWSLSSGGSAASAVPTLTDNVIFDGSGLVNCTINATASCLSLTVNSAYTKTITQAPGITLTVAGNSNWSGGTFSGGNAAITNIGTFTLSGTSFTATSATLSVGGDFTFSSGSFSHNNGTISFDFTAAAVNIGVSNSSAISFNNITVVPYYRTLTINNSITVAGNLTLSGNNAWLIIAIGSGQTLTVNGTLSLTGNNGVSINGGTINVNGDITSSNSSTASGGTGTINISGTGNQTLTGSGTINQGSFPNITINKTSGTLSLSSYITCIGPSWTYTAGTISPGTSTICFYNTGAPYTISGVQTLNNVVFYGNFSTFTINQDLTTNNLTLDATIRCSVTVSSSLTVNGTLTITGAGFYKLNTGTINVKGDVIDNNTYIGDGGGTASFIINGTGNQQLTGGTAVDQGALPPFTINKPSGTLSLAGFITLFKDFTWLAGSVNPGTSTCVFSNMAGLGAQSLSASASGMSFYNLVFEQPDYAQTNITTNISVLGSFKINAACGVQMNSHNMSLAGDFTCLNTTATGASFAFISGTGTVTLNGTGLQKITTSNATSSANLALFYNLIINNSAARSTNDDITLADILTVTNSVSFTQGKILATSTKYLSLQNGATANIGNASSYVNGYMKYAMALNGSRTLNFPIGEGSNWRYVSLNASHNTATSYTYTASVTGSSAGALGYSLPATIQYVSAIRYTTISRALTGGANTNSGLTGNQQITMYYGSDDQVTDYTNLTIAKTTGSGSPWVDIGGIATANTTGTVTSTSSPTAFTGFSSFALANRSVGTNPLPITLLDFSASLVNESAFIRWHTESEINNNFFEVQRSKDVEKWEALARVQGAGNSASRRSYSYTDTAVYGGQSFYRLRQVDFDGGESYSSVVMMNVSSSGLLLYPNPASNYVVLQGEDVDTGVMQITSMQGEDATSKVKMIATSDSKISLDISELPSAIYLVRIRNRSFKIYKQ